MISGVPNDDNELFRQIARDDEEAFRVIFARYGAILYPYVLGMVKQEAIAREIIQDVFLRVWLKRETLPFVEKPVAWLYRLAANHSLNQLKRRQIEARVLADIRHSHPGVGDPVTETLQARELDRLIARAVDRLPTQRRKVFTLIREQGLSRREVAAQLNISENTVKDHLSFALKSIQAFIQQSTGSYIPLILFCCHWPH